MPHAKEAAESYSAWGLLVLAECHEAMHDWTDAEAIYKAVGERYSGAVADWYDFCRRTGHGDLAAARRKFAEVADPTGILVSREAVVYYLLEKDPDKVHTVFEHLARDGNPVCDLHLALLADQAHDKSTRDKILDRVKQKAAQYRLDEEPAELCELRRPGRIDGRRSGQRGKRRNRRGGRRAAVSPAALRGRRLLRRER